MKKPAHIIEKERNRKAERVWLFGLHAVRDALQNPARKKHRLVVTKNALDRLGEAMAGCDLEPEITNPRQFNVPIDENSVHQGVALEVSPLNWPSLEDVARAPGAGIIVALDRVSDPHNVGAILRSAEVFGARAVIAPERHSAPESGALAKTASGALERQPYLRVGNLANALLSLSREGWHCYGLDGEAQLSIDQLALQAEDRVVIVLGAEGPGLRELTRQRCDDLLSIPSQHEFTSLNVSNAAAVTLYAIQSKLRGA